MDSIPQQLLLQVILILINAFFAMTEIAVISLTPGRLRMLAEEGDKAAPKLLKLVEEPAGFLSTIQIAITLSGFLGAAFGAEPSAAAEVTRAVRAVTKKPIILKLSPTAADIAAVAKACEDAGADGVSLINTLPGMRIDLARRRPLLANRTGGMSGPGMFPLAVRMVYQVYEAVHIPIVGMGGVTSAQDVLELMLAGATAVGVGAANLVEPYACKHIIETLPDAMARFGIDNLRDIIGGAHHG